MKKISKNISLKLTNANVLFTILIVWLHVSSNYDLPLWVGNLAIVCVPCFFAISSFLYFKSFDFENPWISYREKLRTRFSSLLIPFFLYTFIGFLINIVFHVLHPVSSNPLYSFLENPLWYIIESKANGPLWYLLSLFEFVLFAPILGWIIKRSKLSILLLPILFYICKDFRYIYFLYWMPNIFLGAYLCIYYDWFSRMKTSYLTLLGGVIIMVFLAFGIMGKLDTYTTRMLAPIGFVLVYQSISILPSKLVSFLAPYSLLIYCLHLPMSRVAIRVPMICQIDSPLIGLLISTIVTILLIVIIGKFLRRCPKLWNIATGGR